VWAAREGIEDVELVFSDLKSDDGKVIPVSEMTCFNLGGVDWLGRHFEKGFAVGQGKIRPLWIGVQVPQDASGTYQGNTKVRPKGAKETTVQVQLDVAGAVLEDAGDSELWRFSRLRWLNSTLGIDFVSVAKKCRHGETTGRFTCLHFSELRRKLTDEIVPPYAPLEVTGNTVKCLGEKSSSV